MDSIELYIGAILGLSVATERLVEIVKGFVPALSVAKTDPKEEERRKALIHVLSTVCGVITAFLSFGALPSAIRDHPILQSDHITALALGILASGGSGLWNSLLGYTNQAKELKKQEAKVARTTAVAPLASPATPQVLQIAVQPPVSGGAFPPLNIGAEQVTSNECYDVKEA